MSALTMEIFQSLFAEVTTVYPKLNTLNDDGWGGDLKIDKLSISCNGTSTVTIISVGYIYIKANRIYLLFLY